MDWWALGILIFEMLAGYPPFFDDNPFGIYEKILSGKIDWPRQIEPLTKDLIKKLLVQDRTKRLGKYKTNSLHISHRKDSTYYTPAKTHYRTCAIISRGLYFFTQFSLWLRLSLQTIYVLKMDILHFLSSKSAAYKREWLQIESGL